MSDLMQMIDQKIGEHYAGELLSFDAFLRWPDDVEMPAWMVEWNGLARCGRYVKHGTNIQYVRGS